MNMDLSNELNKMFENVISFSTFNKKFAILNYNKKFSNEDVKVYVAKFPNGTYKVFDGGNTFSKCLQFYDVSDKNFIQNFKDQLIKNKISKQDDVVYIDCYEKDLYKSIFKLYSFENNILTQ